MLNLPGYVAESSPSTTVIPRWELIDHGKEGAWGLCEIAVPKKIFRAVSLTDRPFAALAAAYAKVASVLTGESSISVGYRSSGFDGPQLLRISVQDGTWLDLIGMSDRALLESGSSSTDEPVVPEFETILDVAGWTGDEGPEIYGDRLVLLWSISVVDGSPRLRLKYRADLYGEECIARYAGYYLRALELSACDPDARHNGRSLVSSSELSRQWRELSGQETDIPAKAFHQLFAEQVERNPRALAVKHGNREFTYQDLDRLANRIANCLLHHGLTAEGVVAVSLSRSVEWVASIIGVLRAGGAYLPVDPDWPIDRLNGIIRRAEPQFLLLGRAREDAGDLVDSLGETTRMLTIDDAINEHSDIAPSVDVSASHLAYIYFTSGSTGEPKGAMCEHAGMMNHLLAKLEDLDITRDDILVQNAPSTFDISLWQAIAPLLVGASTVILPAETVRDIDDFLIEIEKVGATVIQVVPSYLELLVGRISEAGSIKRLPSVRHVVVTGEALKKGLVERWFESSDIPLTNAYGATEASDDTTHHLMYRPPASTSVPVGRPVRNVRILIVDDNLQVVPLGALGEIAFAGPCVGRGYVNDEKRTDEVFVSSRTDPSVRIYRTGDYGRWRPEGVLEFSGRRDEQIKIRGFRVELGEIENAMLRVDGVRDAAVVVTRGTDTDSGLIGYYTTSHGIDSDFMRGALSEMLPEYMIPSHLYELPDMPLTDNSKIDKKALINRPVEENSARAERSAPRTEAERMLAEVWADLLGVSVSSVGRDDDFFDRGGSSLSAIRLVVKLGRQISLNDVANSPVLSDLAAIIDRSGNR